MHCLAPTRCSSLDLRGTVSRTTAGRGWWTPRWAVVPAFATEPSPHRHYWCTTCSAVTLVPKTRRSGCSATARSIAAPTTSSSLLLPCLGIFGLPLSSPFHVLLLAPLSFTSRRTVLLPYLPLLPSIPYSLAFLSFLFASFPSSLQSCLHHHHLITYETPDNHSSLSTKDRTTQSSSSSSLRSTSNIDVSSRPHLAIMDRQVSSDANASSRASDRVGKWATMTANGQTDCEWPLLGCVVSIHRLTGGCNNRLTSSRRKRGPGRTAVQSNGSSVHVLWPRLPGTRHYHGTTSPKQYELAAASRTSLLRSKWIPAKHHGDV